MDLKEYQEVCKITAKKFDNKELEIFNCGLGITGEAGDVTSCIKKTFTHKNDVRDGIKENLGDTLWYIATICNFFGWELQDVMEENAAKLKKRYPNGFKIKNARRKNVDWGEN